MFPKFILPLFLMCLFVACANETTTADKANETTKNATSQTPAAPPPAQKRSSSTESTKLLAGQRAIMFNMDMKDYVIKKKSNIAVADTNPLKTKQLKVLNNYNYESKEPIKDDMNLRFSLSIYEYENPAAVKQAMDKFAKAANPDWGYSKAWDYLYPYDNSILWLNGGCSISAEQWATLSDLFLSKLEVDAHSNYQWIACKCDGGCKNQ